MTIMTYIQIIKIRKEERLLFKPLLDKIKQILGENIESVLLNDSLELLPCLIESVKLVDENWKYCKKKRMVINSKHIMMIKLLNDVKLNKLNEIELFDYIWVLYEVAHL
eukprot:433572_1